MKMAKSYKIILLIVVAVIAFAMAIATISFTPNKVYAASATSYVSGATVSFSDDKLVVAVENDTEFTFKNKVLVDDFAIDFEKPDNEVVSKITFTISIDSFLATGNIKENKLYTSIDNEIVLEYVDDLWKLSINDSDKQTVDLSNGVLLKLSVENHLLKASIGGTSVISSDEFYRIATIGNTIAKTFKAKVNANGSSSIKINSVDQKASDETGEYKQSFVNANSTITYASPRIGISSDLYVADENGNYSLIVNNGTEYTLSTTVYSFCGNVSTSSIVLKAGQVPEGNIAIPSENYKNIYFNKISGSGAKTFTFKAGINNSDDFKSYEEISVLVVDKDLDETAPKFNNDSSAMESFLLALKNQYFVEAEGDTPSHSVVLGNDMTIPSFKSLVYDNYSAYNNLKYTLYYGVPSSASINSSSSKISSGSIKISLSNAGDYMFCVSFEDENSNAMDKEDFIVDDEFIDSDFVFAFSVNDDAPIKVEMSNEAIGNGVVGTTYNAVSFDIDGTGFNTTYKLFYNSNKNATVDSEGWYEIDKFSSVSKDTYSSDYFSYSDVKEINYNGELQFTPYKTGAYKITCTVSSKVSSYRFASASQVIVVDKTAKEVYPSTELTTKNILAIVFLSVGTVCLVAIVVLIFVKPKNKKETEVNTKPISK